MNSLKALSYQSYTSVLLLLLLSYPRQDNVRICLLVQFRYKTLVLLLLLSSPILSFHHFFQHLFLLTFPSIYFYYFQIILHFHNICCKSLLILSSVVMLSKAFPGHCTFSTHIVFSNCISANQ